MKQQRKLGFVLTVCVSFLVCELSFAQQFEGRVFVGDVGVESTPLSGVTITLYHSDVPNDLSPSAKGSSTTTDGNGWYKLDIPGPSNFFTIVETDPSGYNSSGARSVDGTVINSNQIRYSGNLSTKTLSGNKFYDKVNNPPVARIGGPYTCYFHAYASVEGSGSNDPDPGDSIVSYQWDIYNTSVSASPLESATSTANQTDIYLGLDGDFSLVLTVADIHGAEGKDTTSISIGSTALFSGRVYEGDMGVETTPIAGVTVTLYGSNDPNPLNPGTPVVTTTTDVTGWYGLSTNFMFPDYNLFNYVKIIETDPAGYFSTGVRSVDGILSGTNQIHFTTYNLTNKTITGNKFYDQKSLTSVANDAKKEKYPDHFTLYPNYPNPFNPTTTIRFDLPQSAHVRLSIYDLLGQETAVLIDENRTGGSHEVQWDGRNARHILVPSGMYFFRLESGVYHETGKLLLLK
jgi:hypothetical protein